MAQSPELLLMDELSALDVSGAANTTETLQYTNQYNAWCTELRFEQGQGREEDLEADR